MPSRYHVAPVVSKSMYMPDVSLRYQDIHPQKGFRLNYSIENCVRELVDLFLQVFERRKEDSVDDAGACHGDAQAWLMSV